MQESQITVEPENTLEIIGEYALGFEIMGLGSHSEHPQYHRYVLEKLTTYAVKTRCSICNRRHIANRIVTLKAVDGEGVYSSGLDCLGNHFSIDRSDVEKAVEGRAAFASQISRLTGQKGFDTELDVARAVLGILLTFPEVEGMQEARERLEALIETGELIGSQWHEVEHLMAFALEVREASENLDLWHDRLRAISHDPYWPVNNTDRNRIARITSPHDLTPELASVLNRARKSLLVAKPESHDKNHVRPWDFARPEDYERGLRQHYVDLADACGVGSALLRKAFNGSLNRDHLADMPSVVGLLVSTNGEVSSYWTIPDLLHKVAKLSNRPERALRTYLSPYKHSHEVRSGVGKTLQILPRVFRGLAVWEVKEWRDVYSLWHAYRVAGGREYLLRAPALTLVKA